MCKVLHLSVCSFCEINEQPDLFNNKTNRESSIYIINVKGKGVSTKIKSVYGDKCMKLLPKWIFYYFCQCLLLYLESGIIDYIKDWYSSNISYSCVSNKRTGPYKRTGYYANFRKKISSDASCRRSQTLPWFFMQYGHFCNFNKKRAGACTYHVDE